jgi:hypothetical protein
MHIAAFGLGEALMEPEMKNCGTDRPLFFRPLPEAVAKNIATACRAQIDREGIRRRSLQGRGWLEFEIIEQLGFLLDPINLVGTVCFSFLCFWGWRRTKRLFLAPQSAKGGTT